MAKKVQAYVKRRLQLVWRTQVHQLVQLWVSRVNIMEFCKAFNAKTESRKKVCQSQL